MPTLPDDLLALAPSPEWQSRARYHIMRCQNTLWAAGGRRGLDYLMNERGLTEKTIRHFRLGYNGGDVFDPPDKWGQDGKKIYLPGPGIVIPHISGVDEEGKPVVWGMKVRRFEPPSNWDGKRKNWRYTAPRGTVTCVLGLDDFGQGLTGPPPSLAGPDYKRPLLFCSGEFDLMTAWQEAGPGSEMGAMVDVSSLAGEGKGLPGTWFDFCMAYELILIGYDADAEGQKATSKLVESLPQARNTLWLDVHDRPKDINAILTTPYFSVRDWLAVSVFRHMPRRAGPVVHDELQRMVERAQLSYPLKIFWPVGYPPTGDECYSDANDGVAFDCLLSVYHTPDSLYKALYDIFLFRTCQALGGEFYYTEAA